jgi:hypothetical protein
MKVKFGDFEEVENADYVKQKLTDFFKPTKSDKFKEIFIAYPHQCFSEEYAPAEPDKELLEMYIYSIPKDVKADAGRTEILRMNGVNLAPVGGQRDCLKVHEVPKTYDTIEDETGNVLAILKNNHIWVTNDICHGMVSGSDGVDQMFNTYMGFVGENFLNPPTPEELEERVAQSLKVIIERSFNETTKKIESEVHSLSTEVASTQTRYTDLIAQLSRKSEILELAKQRNMPDPKVLLNKVKKFPWVDHLNLKSGMISVETKPISIGPFLYGSWKISLAKEVPIMKHEVQGKTLHPYEWDEHHGNKYCLGGFAHDYTQAYNRGDIVEAFSICKLEITSYSIDTKMTPIEKFFTAIMGKKALDKIFDEVSKENKFKESDGVQILSINGHEVTYVGYKRLADGTNAVNRERAVINYE